MTSQEGIVPALLLYLSSFHTKETIDSPDHRILVRLKRDIENDSLPPPVSPPPPPPVSRFPHDLASFDSEDSPPSSPFASDLSFPSASLSPEDEVLLLRLTSAQLSALSAALDWLLAELRQHMEDESDMRLTAMLQTIGMWSTLKDAIEERRDSLSGQPKQDTQPADRASLHSRL